MTSAPSPFTVSASERFNSPTMSSTESGCSTKTFERESSAELSSKEGFSVVAPMSVMLPFST